MAFMAKKPLKAASSSAAPWTVNATAYRFLNTHFFFPIATELPASYPPHNPVCVISVRG